MTKIRLHTALIGFADAGDILDCEIRENGHAIWKSAKESWTIHPSNYEIVTAFSQKATDFLSKASSIMHQRAQQYDKPDGERSMDATVNAFNAVTGRDLTESEGWLLMLLLKNVRQWQKPEYHADSAEDSVAYSALLAEALAKGK